MKYSEIIGGETKYFKLKPEGSDKWYVGKVTASKIPKGAYALNFTEYFKMRYGNQMYLAWKKQVDMVTKANRGELIIEDGKEYKNLPNPNDEQALKNILQITKQVN